MKPIAELWSRSKKYYQKQLALENVKKGWEMCPKCADGEIYYENPQTGNGLYNCDECGYSAHGRKFKAFPVRKYILRRWRK